MTELGLFLMLLKDSALALGGLGSLPLIRQDLVAAGVATDAQVVEAIAIGRLSTGPSGLWIVSLGYLVAGWVGATLALIASCLPPLVIVPLTIAARRYLLTAPFAGLVRGATLATAGLLASTGLSLVAPDLRGTAAWQYAVAGLAVAVTYDGRVHPALVVIAGAAAGIALSR